MNFNPPMCKAGKICIAEVEEIVEIDEIPPGQVITFCKGIMLIFCIGLTERGTMNINFLSSIYIFF